MLKGTLKWAGVGIVLIPVEVFGAYAKAIVELEIAMPGAVGASGDRVA